MWKYIWSRISNLFKSKTLATVDKLENPVEMYELAVRESDLNIQNITKALSVALADQKNRERQLEQSKLESESWTQKAKAALQSGQQDLAVAALERKSISDKKVEEYTAINQALRQKIDIQIKQLENFKVKHEELKAKKSIYTAKYETAKALKTMTDSMGGLNNSALSEIGRLEEKINKMDAEAEAIMELTSGDSQLENRLSELATSSKVQDDLERLKAEVAQADEAKKAQKLKNIEQQLNVPAPKAIEAPKDKDKLLNEFYTQQAKSLPSGNKDSFDDFFNKKS